MLEFSPDLDARFCYLLVFLCGVGSASVQISGRLSLLQRRSIYAWELGSMRFIFSLYLLIPVGLFWFLDRVGALRDTSVFSALLVGLTYPAILRGKSSIKSSEDLSGLMNWLTRATDGLTEKATRVFATKEFLFRKSIVAILVAEANAPGSEKPKFEAVKTLALQALLETDDREESEKAFNEELAAAAGDPEKRATVVFEYAATSRLGMIPFDAVRAKLGLAKSDMPYYGARWKARAYWAIVILLTMGVLWNVYANPFNGWYLFWRLEKPATTAHDFHRCYEEIANNLSPNRASPEVSEATRANLTAALQRPGLNPERIDEVVGILLQARGETGSPEFHETVAHLLEALRASSLAVRTQVHRALVLLAEETAKANEAGLKEIAEAEPATRDEQIDREKKRRGWRNWWKAVGVSEAVFASHPRT